MTEWVIPLCNTFSLIGIFLLVYVMLKAENFSRAHRLDPQWLRSTRLVGFTGAALLLCYSIVSDNWERSVPVLLLLVANDVLLAINSVSLHLRNPPRHGSRIYTKNGSVARHLGSYVAHYFGAKRPK